MPIWRSCIICGQEGLPRDRIVQISSLGDYYSDEVLEGRLRMLYQVKGVCQHCAAEYVAVISEDQSHGTCSECNERPIKFKKFKGVIYIISNPYQEGVKIGLTTNNIETRLSQLSSTGVPGKFSVIALFPSDRPKEDEKKAHVKLAKHKLDKEHFNVSALDAVMGVHRALNRRVPIFFDEEIEGQFEQAKELARQQMRRNLAGRS